MATERRRIATRQSPKGSGKFVKIHDDLHSALVHEIVQQMNFVEIPITKELLGVADTATARIALGSWRWDVWIRDVRFTNMNVNAYVDGDTDILLKYAASDDADLVAGPSVPTTLLALEGFATGNFPAETALWGNEFAVGTNVDALTGLSQGILVPAGTVLYAEFVNNEGAARDLQLQVSTSPFDFLELQPRGLQRRPQLVSRFFQRTDRSDM